MWWTFPPLHSWPKVWNCSRDVWKNLVFWVFFLLLGFALVVSLKALWCCLQMDSQLACMMSESSIDYIARFNDLAQELAVTEPSIPPPWGRLHQAMVICTSNLQPVPGISTVPGERDTNFWAHTWKQWLLLEIQNRFAASSCKLPQLLPRLVLTPVDKQAGPKKRPRQNFAHLEHHVVGDKRYCKWGEERFPLCLLPVWRKKTGEKGQPHPPSKPSMACL